MNIGSKRIVKNRLKGVQQPSDIEYATPRLMGKCASH